MMSPREINEALARFSYKPGVTFQFKMMTFLSGIGQFFIRHETVCADNGKPTVIHHQHNLPIRDVVDIYYLKAFVINRVKEMESHESMEWLRFDGERLRQPHPELHLDPPPFQPVNDLQNAQEYGIDDFRKAAMKPDERLKDVEWMNHE